MAGVKDVHERRKETGALRSQLLRLRADYEAACEDDAAGGFELIHPSPSRRLQELYELLSQTSARAHAEDNGSRIAPPILMGDHIDEWCQMFKCSRSGQRVLKQPAEPPTSAEGKARTMAQGQLPPSSIS